jgi:DNA gyrase subunit B
MDVTVNANHTKYTLHFEKGVNVGGLTKEPYSGRRTGTIQRWRPDLDVFTDIQIPPEYFLDIIKRQSVVNPGIEFVFRNQVDNAFEETVFLYENGISDYVQEMIGDKGLTAVHHWQTERRVRDRADKPEYKTKISVAIAFSNQVKCMEYYHNSSWLEYGGAPEKAVRSALLSQIDAYLKQNNKYNKSKNEGRISFADIEDCLVLVTSSFSNVTSYENQTKKAITNKGIQEAMTDFLRHQMEIYFIENPAEAEKIAAQVLINKRSREDAEKTRLNLKKKLSGGLDMTNRVQKFVDCRSRDVARRELFIVEGDSALGSCKLARDPDFQAIIPLRGKILNCLKADYDKIFKNEVITDLLRVLGCGVEVKSKANKDLAPFDLDALRWNKVIICTDADVDGFQIRTLVLTMLYRLTPSLIEAGKVFIAESPLFEITTKKQTYFAYTEKEKTDILARIGKEKCTIQRSKGLGENQPEMMSLTTMAPETRRLIQVLPAMAEETAEVFDLLLGDNLTGRKNYIAANGQDYIELADIS